MAWVSASAGLRAMACWRRLDGLRGADRVGPQMLPRPWSKSVVLRGRTERTGAEEGLGAGELTEGEEAGGFGEELAPVVRGRGHWEGSLREEGGLVGVEDAGELARAFVDFGGTRGGLCRSWAPSSEIFLAGGDE